MGGDGDDLLKGGAGDDILSGDSFATTKITDDWYAYQARGTVSSQGIVYGASKDDGSGKDTIFGGSGNDLIFGGKDNDWLDGGEDDDAISGDAGDDTVIRWCRPGHALGR